MLPTTTFDPEKKIIYVVASGAQNNRFDALESMRNTRMDARFDPGFGILVDVRASDFQINELEATSIGVVFRSFFTDQKIAFVAHEPLVGLIERTHATAFPVVDVKIFAEIEKAEAWLRAV